MRNSVFKIIDGHTNATFTSNAVWTRQIFGASFMAVFSANDAAGAAKVQASNDPPNGDTDFAPTNWVDVPSATVTISSGASAFIPMPTQFAYQWLRVVWTRTGGAGTFTVFMNQQGV